jgi:16S rRNA (guanine966-N2)-methyltransferase
VDFAAAAPRLSGQLFDIVFLDPPYGAEEMTTALTAAAGLAAGTTRVIIEHAKRDTPPSQTGGLVLTRQLTSGDSALAFYKPLQTS